MWQREITLQKQRNEEGKDVYKRQALSHVNDAGFWLVGTFLEIDEKTTLKSWTIMETLIGITGLVLGLVISVFA